MEEEHLRVAKERKQMEIQRKHEQMERAQALALKHNEKEIELERRVESLGLRNFEGIQAEVTRSTTIIPACAESNDRPFEIVSERWFSPELQIIVIARSLFEPPADFTVIEERIWRCNTRRN